MPLAVIPDSLKKLPDRWLDLVNGRRSLTPADPAADALEQAAKQLQAAIAEAEDESKTLSTKEFAMLRRVKVGTVRKWCERGVLPGAVKTDAGDWRIPAGATRRPLARKSA